MTCTGISSCTASAATFRKGLSRKGFEQAILVEGPKAAFPHHPNLLCSS